MAWLADCWLHSAAPGTASRSTFPVSVQRVLGVDDWAWKKGHRYWIILCDLEAGTVVALLPDREAGTVATWLQEHLGTEIISRDRPSSYAKAARKAAPHAVQIADRLHLLRNLSEALRNALEPHRRIMIQAPQTTQRSSSIASSTPVAIPADPVETMAVKYEKNQRRHDLYQQLRALMESGVSSSAIAHQLGLGLCTAQRRTRAGAFPERTPRLFPNSVDQYVAYLDRRLLDGCRNVSQLWRELQQQSFRGQHSSVCYWLRKRRRLGPKTSTEVLVESVLRLSPQQTAWQILKGMLPARPTLRSCIVAPRR